MTDSEIFLEILLTLRVVAIGCGFLGGLCLVLIILKR